MSDDVGPEATMAVVRELAAALTRWLREPDDELSENHVTPTAPLARAPTPKPAGASRCLTA